MDPQRKQAEGADDGAPRWTISLFVSSVGLWTGAALFLSAGVLPTLFLNLPPQEAGRIAALVFPLYFRAGVVMGLLAISAAMRLAVRGGTWWKRAAALLVVMTLAQGWSAVVLHPEMARIRGVEDQVARFQQLHEWSVRLNAVVLGGGLLLCAGSGWLLARRRGEA